MTFKTSMTRRALVCAVLATTSVWDKPNRL